MTTIAINQNLHCSVTTKVDLPDGIEWKDVKNWYVKWDHLNIQIGDEWQELILESTQAPEGLDWKRPSLVTVLGVNEDGNEDWNDVLAEQSA